MESNPGSRMKISWIFANSTVLDPVIDISAIKDIGPTWGSWRTWRGCQTDNVICHELRQAQELIQREFQSQCNFYIPQTVFTQLGQPSGVQLFDGDFKMELDNPEEIIAMHLSASQSDIVLLMGFDWTKKDLSTDRLVAHRTNNYRNLVKHAIANNSNTQWVLLDNDNNLIDEIKNLPNLSFDRFDNVLKIFNR